jgi:hypothetical protein
MRIPFKGNKDIGIMWKKSGRETDFEHTSPLKSFNPLFMIIPLIESVMGNPCQHLLIFSSVKPCPLQFEDQSSTTAHQFAMDKKESFSYSLYHVLLWIQYFFLKEIHKIIGKHQKLNKTPFGRI